MDNNLKPVSFDYYISLMIDEWQYDEETGMFHVNSVYNRNELQVPDQLWSDLLVNHLNNFYN